MNSKLHWAGVQRNLKLHMFLCGLVLSIPSIAPAITYTTIDDAPGPDLKGINKAGQIVGNYVDVTSFTSRSFLKDGGTFTTNDVYNSPIDHGFLLDKGNYTTIDFPGSVSTEANGINIAGQIVGTY